MQPELPLTGLTVVELGHSVAAPFGGLILAELGAQVVKVEAPDVGDDARGWGPPFWHGASATFQSLNRDKYSVAVNLKDPAERDVLRRYILREADIVIQNLRPGLAARFELDARLMEVNSRLIYCNVGAFGAKGPFREMPGYDPLMQAFGGVMSITGEPNRPPVRVGPAIIDMATGMWAVIGILAALRQRDATGKGCLVDTSLYETAVAWMTVHGALCLASGKAPGRSGSETQMLAPYKAYEAADGYLVIAAGNDNLFRRLCEVLGQPQWVDDARFRSNADRVDNRQALNALIEDIIIGEPRESWLKNLSAAGVPCAPLQNVAEVLAHPQTAALEMLQSTADGAMSFIGLPVSLDGRRPPLRRKPPRLGEDNGILAGEDPTDDKT
jgi:crotonobetainyl-CoA:carnitine CoA-transferase CaiB-like acyl-CoA transferase